MSELGQQDVCVKARVNMFVDLVNWENSITEKRSRNIQMPASSKWPFYHPNEGWSLKTPNKVTGKNLVFVQIDIKTSVFF